MECKYAVTFEFPLDPPITERGTIKTVSLRTAVARAVDKAKKKHPRVKWSSVVVLIDRG